MKQFKVMASYITYCTVEIEAENEEQAFDMALEMDGGLFEEQGGSDWNIDEVKEIKQ